MHPFCWWASNPYLCFFFAGMKRYTSSASCGSQKKSWMLDGMVRFIINAWLCCVIRYNVFFVCDVVVLSWVQVLSVKVVSSCNDRRTKLKDRSNANPFYGKLSWVRLRIVNCLLFTVGRKELAVNCKRCRLTGHILWHRGDAVLICFFHFWSDTVKPVHSVHSHHAVDDAN